MFVWSSTYREEKRSREAAEQDLAAEHSLRLQAEAREAAQQVLIVGLQANNASLVDALKAAGAQHEALQIDLLDRLEPKPISRTPDEDGNDGENVMLSADQVESMHVIGKRGMRLRRHLLRQAREREAKQARGSNKSEFAAEEATPSHTQSGDTSGDGSILREGEQAILDMLIKGQMPDMSSTEASN